MPRRTATRRLLTLALLSTTLSALLTAQNSTETWRNPAAAPVARAADLVSRMTLEEKIAQMQNAAPAIPRLDIPAYDWWNEALHGVARSGSATVFPQAIGMAATWNPALIERVADAISTEARAKYNDALAHGNHAIYYGLTMWSPNINIVRDPRWGRGQETYGEDPFLTGQIGAAFVRGLQGKDLTYLKTVATAKHFAVHSGPESSRHTFDVPVSPYDLADTYLPAFRNLIVNAHAASVMCAYNSVDNAPACASDLLLQKTLKRDWHFNGYVVSDCAAITDVAIGHKFSPDVAHAAAASVKAGTDLSCGKEYAALADAVKQGLITEPEIDAAVTRLFTARFRLGMFDPGIAFNRIPFSEVDSPAHVALSLEAARASMVLLKNDAAILPLKTSLRSIAVVGPNAAALPALEGNYNAVASHPVTPLEALSARLPGRVHYAEGAAYVEGLPVPVPETLFTPGPQSTASGLHADYFTGTAFAGKPLLTRTDRHIDFDWNGATPDPAIDPTAFSVRWSGLITPPASGHISFGFSMAHCSSCDDAETVRVWLDGKLVYDFNHAATRGRRAPTPPFDLTFTDTAPHPLRIEYTHSAAHFGAGLTFNWHPPADALRDQAVAAARASDLTIAFLGLSPEIEGEEMPVHVEGFNGGDRDTIELPAAQQKLVTALAATGKPLVVVLMNGSALALQASAAKAHAILEAWYPGEAGGTAIADTLFGDHNPSGRLPITFYAATSQLPAFDDYSMKQRTYRYFTGQPLYPFGYGLSYTHFGYSSAKIDSLSIHAGQALSAAVTVKNTGDRDGEETVEFYLLPKAPAMTPRLTLVALQKVFLRRGESRILHALVDPRQLSFVSADGSRSIRSGDYELFIGGGQPAQASLTGGVSVSFRIEDSLAIAP